MDVSARANETRHGGHTTNKFGKLIWQQKTETERSPLRHCHGYLLCPASKSAARSASRSGVRWTRRWGKQDSKSRTHHEEKKAMGNHSRQASPPRTWTCKWLRLSCRRLQLATPRRAFRRSGTEGSNPVPSTKSYDMRPTVRGRSPGRAKQLARPLPTRH